MATLSTYLLNIYFIALMVIGISYGRNPNIVGGSATNIAQQPWQVYITYNGNGVCGGSIIGPNTVLTAAHCVNNYSASQIQVNAGATFRSQIANSQVRSASRVIIHPNYNGPSHISDIAIVELSTPFNFNSDVQPIRYDGGVSLSNSGVTATTSGWGEICQTCSQPDQLQRLNLTTVDINSLNPNDYDAPLNSNMIAAGNVNQLAGPCRGDSGGPLWVNDNGQNVLIGVTSFMPTTGCGTRPGIFTRVSSYCQWIFQQVTQAASIMGSGAVCNSVNYSISNQPSNSNVIWSTSNPSVLAIGSNGIATRQNNYNDLVTITATFSNNCSSTSISRNITVGPPLVGSILVNGQNQSPANICVNNFASVDVIPSDANSSYNWSLNNSGNAYLTNYSSSNTSFNAYTADCFQLGLQVSNACGITQRGLSICAQNCSARYTVFPNPADEYINIEFENTDNAESLPDEILLFSEGSGKSVRTINMSEAFKSESFKNRNQIILDVRDLPRGVYFLHVKDDSRKDKNTDAIRILLR